VRAGKRPALDEADEADEADLLSPFGGAVR
jgi:hypothetical protein